MYKSEDFNMKVMKVIRTNKQLFFFILLLSCVVLWISTSRNKNCPEINDIKRNDHINEVSKTKDQQTKLLVNEKNGGDDYNDDDEDHKRVKIKEKKTKPAFSDFNLDKIDCKINGEYTVDCRREGAEIYMPFSFVKKYFEVYGKMSNADDGVNRFEMLHSYSQYFTLEEKYSSTGVFMSFEHYNVEERDRVKCISGEEGVPISIQWGAHGYFYPIQIAQFGLSHYSKHLTDNIKPMPIIFCDGSSVKLWQVQSGKTSVKSQVVDGNAALEFNSPDSLKDHGVLLKLNEGKNFVLSLSVKFITNGSFTVKVIQKTKASEPIYISYVQSTNHIYMVGNHIYYGIGERTKWSKITRNIPIDIKKGFQYRLTGGQKMKKKQKFKVKTSISKIDSITLNGHGWVDNITLSKTAHLDHFYDAARWLLRNQDDKGGWPIMVVRRLTHLEPLEPGWYSAMAQGQAMSLLVRAYYTTKDIKYLDAALKATAIFHIPSKNNGILAKFMNVHDWYEEYPTTPSSFVLNGFIYSLFGLYDVISVVSNDLNQDAKALYNNGMKSLKAMLLMFDTGSGSVYDLRHVILGVAPNLARWDYHTTHITQLLLLADIDDDPIFKNTAERWIGYMKGKRASHN